MNVSIEEVIAAVGDGLLTPSLGDAELVLAALVALAFLWSVIRSMFGDGEDREPSWREPRS